ncbi:SDCB1 protein, partial [Atractosteus spatula]|nr:SDCB1 protein [Atractosteus spatula]
MPAGLGAPSSVVLFLAYARREMEAEGALSAGARRGCCRSEWFSVAAVGTCFLQALCVSAPSSQGGLQGEEEEPPPLLLLLQEKLCQGAVWERLETITQVQPLANTDTTSVPVSDGPSPPRPPAERVIFLYPDLQELGEYMGLRLNSDEVRNNLALVPAADNQVAMAPSAMGGMVCPVTGGDVGVRRAEIKQGLREVILCKDQEGKMGLRLRSIDNGVFIQLVQANSPAALAGLRFGDQVLQINGQNCAGWSQDKAHKMLKVAAEDRIELIVRDRPFQRTITMHKDSSGHVGFIFKNGKVTSIVKDSSAARNGLLTEHNICEINGQNVIGLKVRDSLVRPPGSARSSVRTRGCRDFNFENGKISVRVLTSQVMREDNTGA